MTIQSFSLRAAFAFAALLALTNSASAQATVTPPARAGTAVQGTSLRAVKVADYGACQAECKRTTGCTGYNFETRRDAVPKDGGNCHLYSGALTDVNVQGVVSCRMPCDAGAMTLRPQAIAKTAPAGKPLLLAPAPATVGSPSVPPPPPAPTAKTATPSAAKVQ